MTEQKCKCKLETCWHQDIALTVQIMLVFGGTWKIFEPWIRETIELYNQNLMSYFRRNLEDSISESFKDYGGLVRKFQRKTILATELETISVIFGKGMSAFCLCPNIFPDTKLKSDSSKQHNTDSVA